MDLKIVNASGTPQPLDIDLQGASSVGSTAKLISLSANNPKDTNTITEPTKIIPVESTIPASGTHLNHAFAPYSINVVEIPVK